MKNENPWTQGREYYTLGSTGGNRGGTAWWANGHFLQWKSVSVVLKGPKGWVPWIMPVIPALWEAEASR